MAAQREVWQFSPRDLGGRCEDVKGARCARKGCMTQNNSDKLGAFNTKIQHQMIQSDLFDHLVGGHLTFERVTDHHPKKVTSRIARQLITVINFSFRILLSFRFCRFSIGRKCEPFGFMEVQKMFLPGSKEGG